MWEEQAKVNEKILLNISEFRPRKPCKDAVQVPICDEMLDNDLDF
jgi:hypothetical protein